MKKFIITLFVLALVVSGVGVSATNPVKAEEVSWDKICIVLDPGHGGSDSGTVEKTDAGVTGITEKESTLKVAQYAKAALEEDGHFEVYLTREEDSAVSLAERAAFARDKEADVLVSIHFNSATSTEANGAEVWQSVLPKYQITSLPQQILDSIKEKTGLNITRGVKTKESGAADYWNDTANWDTKANTGTLADYYGLIRGGAKWAIPSMIVEHAFISNQVDLAYLKQAEDVGLKALGEADADALIKFYTNHDHSYGEVETEYPVSCVSAGRQAQHCSICKAKKNVSALAAQPDANAHCVDSYSVVTKATTTKEGSEQGKCIYCGKTLTRTIPKLQAAVNTTANTQSTKAQTTSVSTKITVKKASVSKVKKKKQTVTVTAKKISGVAGYQYRYGSNKKLTKNKKTVNKKSSKLTVKKWKKKTFYVKVRAFKYKENGTKVYGAWSAVKKAQN